MPAPRTTTRRLDLRADEGTLPLPAVLFYHSNCKDPGVYGTATVLVEGHPDESAFDPAHPYYDPVRRPPPLPACARPP